MSDPKILRIMKEISNRLADVRIAAGYYTNAGQQVVRGQHALDSSVLPGFALWLDGNSTAQALQQRAQADAEIVIEAVAKFSGDDEPENIALYLAADISKAIEGTDRTLGGLLFTDTERQGITWQSEEIYYPEDTDNQVGVRVSYAAPYIRRPGDPIN